MSAASRRPPALWLFVATLVAAGVAASYMTSLSYPSLDAIDSVVLEEGLGAADSVPQSKLREVEARLRASQAIIGDRDDELDRAYQERRDLERELNASRATIAELRARNMELDKAYEYRNTPREDHVHKDSRVLFLPAERRGKAGFRFVHIPKTGGASFTDYVYKLREKRFPNEHNSHDEVCLLSNMRSWKSYDPDKDFTASFFRKPRSHVLSQYLMCEHSWWYINRIEYAKFPRAIPKDTLSQLGKKLRSLDAKHAPAAEIEELRAEFDMNYRKVIKKMDAWLDFFLKGWRIEKGAFGCYHPLSMQTRAMTCEGSQPVLHGIWRDEYLTPNIQVAIANMRTLWFIGLQEHFHESLCVWEYQYFHELPDYCVCGSNATRPRIPSSTHDVPPHSLRDLSEGQLDKIDLLTREDAALYSAALDEFMLRLHEVESRTGRKIMCKKTQSIQARTLR